MSPANTFATGALTVLALTASTAHAASKTITTTTSLLLPSITTSANERIYATLISGSEEKDVYSLDCQTNFGASRTCSGAFAGHTLTWGPATIHVDLGTDGTYDCARETGDTPYMQCRVTGGPATTGATATTRLVEGSRITPVTVLGETGKASRRKSRTTTITTDGKTVTTAVPDETSSTAKPKNTAGGGSCKRDLHPRKVGHGTGGADADGGSTSSAGSAGATKPHADEDDDDTTTADGKRRKDSDGCSAGSRTDATGMLGGFLGLGLLVLAFAV